jgi:hypothetical protein
VNWNVLLAGAFVAILFVILPIGSVVVGVRELTYFSAGLDPLHCTQGQSGRCLDTEQAVVEESISGVDRIRVRHDDGRRTMDVYVDWDPPRGYRVVLERWHGRLVSVYDPSREERHKTSEWPGLNHFAGAILMILVGAAFFGLFLYGVCVRVVHAVRRRGDTT